MNQDTDTGSELGEKVKGRMLRGRLLLVVIAGLYTWSVAVLPLLSDSGGNAAAQIVAAVAPLSLIASLFVPSPKGAIALVLHLYLGSMMAALWWLRKSELQSESALSIFAVLGILAYIFAIGALSTPDWKEVEGEEPEAELAPRIAPSRLAAVWLTLAAVLALVLLYLSFAIEGEGLSILAQLSSLGAAFLILGAAVRVAEFFQGRGLDAMGLRQKKGVRWALLLFVLLISLGVSQGFFPSPL